MRWQAAAFILCIAFGALLFSGDLGDICKAGEMFMVALLVHPMCAVANGLALERVHSRAVTYSGNKGVFAGVVGPWYSILVGGSINVGLALWMAGAAVSFLMPGWSYLLPVLVLVAGCSQAAAGEAALRVNRRVREHFASSEGTEMVANAVELSNRASLVGA